MTDRNVRKPFSMMLAVATAAVSVAGISSISFAETGARLGGVSSARTFAAAAAAQADEEKRTAVLKVLTDVADRMVSEDGITSVLDLVAANDRERLESELKNAKDTDNAKKVSDFRSAWRSKYGKDFAASKHVKDFSGATTVDFRDNNNKEYAVVNVPGFGGIAKYEVHLVRNRSDSWRISVPDDRNARQLVRYMQGAVENLNRTKADWPSDEPMAYNSAISQLVSPLNYGDNAETSDADRRAREREADRNADKKRDKDKD